MSYLLDLMATSWISINTLNQRLFTKTQITISGDGQLSPKEWCLVVSNHQSWVDILVLQRVLNHKIPFLKFFLKKELIYVPFLGLAWWALDFPFMKRFSRQFLEKNPHLKGTDIETTRKACKKFKSKPVSIMNFLEGTRFTEQKHKRQSSPFQHLLKPKAGGIAFVLDAMGEYLTKLVNVTIYYPEGIPSFIDFVAGKVHNITVNIEVRPIDKSMIGNYFDDAEFKEHFQQWVNQLWVDKDKKLIQLSSQAHH